jgi:hypothetical protein
VNVDVSDEVLELIANLQARIDGLEEVVYDEDCDCDACNSEEQEYLEIKSVNYVEGKSGWILAKDGVLHMYTGNEKINFYQDGSHNKSTRDLFKLYDSNNTCRVQSGVLV